jgi:hypothetical protein
MISNYPTTASFMPRFKLSELVVLFNGKPQATILLVQRLFLFNDMRLNHTFRYYRELPVP